MKSKRSERDRKVEIDKSDEQKEHKLNIIPDVVNEKDIHIIFDSTIYLWVV